jgi:hypothetical protein
LIAAKVFADVAEFIVREVVAALAIFHLAAKIDDGIAQSEGFLLILTQKMQGQPDGSSPANTWQAGKFVYCVFEQSGRIIAVHARLSVGLSPVLYIFVQK